MLIDLSKIKKDNEPHNFEVSGKLPNDILRNNAKFLGLIAVKGNLRYFDDDAVADGTISFKIETLCDRCGKEIEKVFDFKLKERFLKDSLDHDIYSFSNEELNLTKAVSENIMANLSIQILCDKKCKGLCPSCGANLNENKCKCKKTNDNAFSALKDLGKGKY